VTGGEEVAVVPHDERALAALRAVLRPSHVLPPDDIGLIVHDCGRELGARIGIVYVADYDQVQLTPVCKPDAAAPVAIEGTIAGRAFTDVVQTTATGDDSITLWTPVLDGTERVGVLQLVFPDQPLDAGIKAAAEDVASLLAELLVTRGLYGDAIERTRRRTPMSVPAELQWRLLPPLTFVSRRIAIAGVLAPATEIAGDTFDYALNGDVAHVAIFDAMGHGLEAALLASVAVSTYRNARRAGQDLEATLRFIDAELAAQFGSDKFVTGIVGELDVSTGWWRWATCGHPPALLVRDAKVVKELDQVVCPPLGLRLLGTGTPLGSERLQPGDRLVLYTDGVPEARDEDGTFFGTQRLVEFVARQSAAGRPAAETMRRLSQAILAHQAGSLQDDATTVMVEWLTPEAELSTS
jgi:serine phosphatase RsbU (regulator of sigma subunit)